MRLLLAQLEAGARTHPAENPIGKTALAVNSFGGMLVAAMTAFAFVPCLVVFR